MVFAGGGLRGRDAANLAHLAEALQAPAFANSRSAGRPPARSSIARQPCPLQAPLPDATWCWLCGVDWDFRTGYGGKIAAEAVVIQVDADPRRSGWNRSRRISVWWPTLPGWSPSWPTPAARFPGRETPGRTKEIMDEEADPTGCRGSEAGSATRSPRRTRSGLPARSAASLAGLDRRRGRWRHRLHYRPLAPGLHPGPRARPGPFGTLGTGAPFAIAAKVTHPDKPVGHRVRRWRLRLQRVRVRHLGPSRLARHRGLGQRRGVEQHQTFHRAMFPDRLVASDLGRRPYHAVVDALGGLRRVGRATPPSSHPPWSGPGPPVKPSLVDVHIAETMRMSSNYSQ